MRDDPLPAAVADPRPPPGPPEPGTSARGAAETAWERLDDQLRWYDARSAHAKRWFHSLKVAQIVIAAMIPVVAAAGASAALAGVMGAAIVVLEGLQQLFQFQQNWVSYRATAEALKHEKYLFAASAGPYSGEPRPHARLAERVEGLVSQEHAAWTSAQREAAKGAATGD